MEPADSRKSPPTFSLTDAKGTPVRLSDYKSRVVLLNFWATWCAGCKTEIPWFIDFEKKYRNKGFDVIGVAMDEDGWKQVAPYVKEKQMNYTVLIGNETVEKLYELSSLPSTLLIDRDGKIAYAHTGVVDKGLCENLIQKLL